MDPEIVIAKTGKKTRPGNRKTGECTDGREACGIDCFRKPRHLPAQEDITTSLEDFFGLAEGVTLTYRDYMIADSYPEDGSAEDYFALDASMEKKLLDIEL